MSIEAIERRAAGKADYLITCDEKGCKGALDAKDRTFEQAILLIKGQGWRITKNYSTFFHRCPNHPE